MPAADCAGQNGDAFVVNRSSDALEIVVSNDLKSFSLPGAEAEESGKLSLAFNGQIDADNILRTMGID